MAREPRKPIPSATELLVLDKSRRRCALCFHISGDLTEKHGQIAHLDQNSANFAEDNLAFLCLTHHSMYDSKTSQHKNYTLAEMKKARASLNTAIATDMHLGETRAQARGRVADLQTLSEITNLFDESTLHFLRTFDFGHAYQSSSTDQLKVLAARVGPEHEFIDHDLEVLRGELVQRTNEFLFSLGMNTWPLASNPGWRSAPSEREHEQWSCYQRTLGELNDRAARFCTAYDTLIRSARRVLVS